MGTENKGEEVGWRWRLIQWNLS